ncbi:MAG: hypothetical protein JWR16_811 [Nevskia sp.]|nr:hypothetical protein [Nevskia sp.]
MKSRYVAAPLLLAALASCSSEPQRKSGPSIRTLTKQQAPAADKLPVVPSEQVAADPQKAVENYQKLLALHPDQKTRSEALRRIADLGVQTQDSAGNPDAAALQRSIGIYQKLLQEQPNDPNNDRVLYQMARAYQNGGDVERALQTLQRLEQQYPNSTVIADAHFRGGEMLYQLNRFPESEKEYRAGMVFGLGSPFYEPAQYKLGWSLYKQQRYAEDITVFFDILTRLLPPGELENTKASLAQVAPGKVDMAHDSLRVVALSFAELGGGKGIRDYFARRGAEPAFYPLVYNALGELFLEKRRYTDAANAYAAFVQAHSSSPLAPTFQTRVIGAFEQGGFSDQVVAEKERYVNLYSPGAAYWSGRTPSDDVIVAVRNDLEDLGRHYQARAQGEKQKDANAARNDFSAAANWYSKIIALYPNDPKLPEVNLLLADSLYDGGRTREAAEQYMNTAYSRGNHPKAAEAGYAAVQAYQRLATEVQAAERPAVLRNSVAATTKLADTFPTHPQVASALTRAAQDLLELKDYDNAVAMAKRVLQVNPPPSPELRGQALGVVADAGFARGDYAGSEAAYSSLLQQTAPGSAQRKVVVEQLAASIYKQGEAARKAGDLRAAANHFLRIGNVVPDASIRPNADYDGATALVALQDWPAAEQALEAYRARYPNNPLSADADKQLAAAYQKDNKPAQAAAAYQRIAAQQTESPDTRREAAWLTAKLYDGAHQPAQAAAAYESYLSSYPQPPDRAMEARQHLADYALSINDRTRYAFWLNAIVGTDSGGAANSPYRLQAAQAVLELGRIAAADARRLQLSLPINKSLPVRKQATETAVQYLTRAAGYGFAETTTAATYELGTVYQDFGKALRDSERPHNLGAAEREQYDLLLEEQATPFDDQAIHAHEGNLERVKQGLWNEWIRKSVDALAVLAPVKYAKRELRQETYETLP